MKRFKSIKRNSLHFCGAIISASLLSPAAAVAGISDQNDTPWFSTGFTLWYCRGTTSDGRVIWTNGRASQRDALSSLQGYTDISCTTN